MGKCYFEFRKPTVRGSESGAADMMRHFRTRQHLGSLLVICKRPEMLLATARKQWLKLARGVQRQRAMTLNADKILKFTHTIIHMQNMRFTVQPPVDDPESDVYFIDSRQLSAHIAPPQCFTVYVHCTLAQAEANLLVSQLPSEALIVDYAQQSCWPKAGVRPKHQLEGQVAAGWKAAKEFLASRDIDITTLHPPRQPGIEVMDDALDSLLEVPRIFLQIAGDFRRTLELARPLRTSKELREQYDVLMLLAHRVQALTMPAFSQLFLESYSEDDTFFLYDKSRRRKLAGGESLSAAVTRHRAAGRSRLADSLLRTRWVYLSILSDNRLLLKAHVRQATE